MDLNILLEQNNELRAINQQLNQQLLQLSNELAAIRLQLKGQVDNIHETPKKQDHPEQYHTDEDELELEVGAQLEWTEVKNKKDKKRKKSEMTPSPSSTKTGNIKKKKQEDKIPLPPPIKVSNIDNFNLFRAQIKGVAANRVQFKALSNNDINVTVNNEIDYRNIKKHLIKIKNNKETANNPFNKLEFHTYQLKTDRWYRVVIRGLPSTTNHDDIKTELEDYGHQVATVTPIVKKTTNTNGEKQIKAFPLFYVDLVQNENNKNIYEIKYLVDCKITIEPPKKNNSIPQCTNCQQLGHTKNFCSREARCVKCAGKHHTSLCRKQRNSVATCALCNEKGHPANYKGCAVYKKKVKELGPRRVTAVQRLRQDNSAKSSAVEMHKPQKTTQPPKVTNMSNEKQDEIKKQEPVTNEPTMIDMMSMLSEFQTEMRQNFSQLANRVEKLEKSRTSQTKSKRNSNE